MRICGNRWDMEVLSLKEGGSRQENMAMFVLEWPWT